MLELQQLGLHFGFKSNVKWWKEAIQTNFHHHEQDYNKRKGDSRGANHA
jgi:hypothetical protein